MTDLALTDIPALRALWAGVTGHEAVVSTPAGPCPPHRPLLDLLGVGQEQALAHLGEVRPQFGDFMGWLHTTARPQQPAPIQRFQAWAEGLPPPPAEQARQAALMALPPVLTAAELATWEADGVLVLRGAIAPGEAEAIADHLWTLLGATPDDPASWYGPRTHGIMVQHFQHPAMDVPRRAPRIARAFAQLYGHADLVASTDRLSFNPPETAQYRFPGPHLHWDASLAPPMPFENQAILYLTDTEADQGALQVVPGFHHRLAEGWLARLNGADPRRIDLSGEARKMAGAAGDLVIWRQEIPHGASANHSRHPRLAQYVNHYPMARPDTRPWL